MRARGGIGSEACILYFETWDWRTKSFWIGRNSALGRTGYYILSRGE